MIDVNVCPNCTEFEVTPKVIKHINKKGFTKYKCPKCGIEFEYKVTKNPDYKNWEKELNGGQFQDGKRVN